MAKNKNLNLGIHWFRRDLRITGNQALRDNWNRTQGRTLGLFCFDSKFLSRPDFSANRFGFFLKSLQSLQIEMKKLGGDLLIVNGSPQKALAEIAQRLKPQIISWNRDYEPFARARDEEVKKLLKLQNIEVLTFRDHLIFEPHEILKNEKDFYQIYSPYGKKWFQALSSELGIERLQSQNKSAGYFKKLQSKNPEALFSLTWDSFLKEPGFPYQDALREFILENQKHVTIPLPEAGSQVAFVKLQEFKEKINNYKNLRDIPSVDGTSKLSIYLKNGSLVSSQILHELGLQKNSWSDDGGPNQYVKEIAWREFYYSILFHRPDVEHSSFLPQYKNLAWENNSAFFQRWCEGSTGFPIIDAGMRQLLQTGWMHNRVRMIVASFLTKDLLIDWRWGEKHFMKYLLDGDLAPNNGGWQWAASTGCDPQPYFRVFNPWLQSEKFDPDGIYIKNYIPELNSAPAKSLHDPDFDRSPFRYPRPMVDHSQQKMKAIALYKLSP